MERIDKLLTVETIYDYEDVNGSYVFCDDELDAITGMRATITKRSVSL